MKTLRFRCPLPASRAELAAWHYRSGAFQRLAPPWNEPQVLNPEVTVEAGALMKFEVKMGPLTLPWEAEITEAGEGGFTDEQRRGLFASWRHEHRFLADEQKPEASLIEDLIEFQGPFPSPISEFFAQREMQRLMAWRHRLFAEDFGRASALGGQRPLNLVITGGTGLVGSALQHLATTQGHQVKVLSRRPRAAHEFAWNPRSGQLEPETLELLAEADVVIHLAGANVAGSRWTPERKQVLLESRTQPTRLLAEALAHLSAHERPQALICASGISGLPLDGTPADETRELDRSSILGEIVAQWEAAAEPARKAGIRTVHARIPPVLDPRGGMLPKLLPLFKLGLGGAFGNPREHFAWIALEDAIEVLLRASLDSRYEGAVHVSAPQTATRAEFARALGSALRRPAFLPAPAFALRAAMGKEMANETALANLNPVPAVLKKLNYPYRFPELEDALAAMLGKPIAALLPMDEKTSNLGS